MSVAVKRDENLGRTHVEILRSAGYEVDRVHDQGLSGAADATVWEHVCSVDRFLVTLDLDFSDVRRYPPGTHPGILLIRSRSRSRTAVAGVLSRVIAERSLDDLRGCLAVADESFTRIRHIPHPQP